MAGDPNARLLIVLEAQSRKLERQLVQASRKIDGFAKQSERRFATMQQRGNASLGLLGKAFAGVVSVRAAQGMIDASTRIENSLKIVGLAGGELTRVYDALFASAQRNGTGMEGLAELYSRAALAQKELGATSAELLGFTDNVAVALRVAGKSAGESRGALIQLSQAIGAGVVRAEEFNAILEGALPIAQATAAGLDEAGGSVAKLRTLVIDGKVSSEAFFRAFEAGSVILQEKVAGAELTISQGFVRLQNVLIDTAGKFDDTTGASAAAAEGLNSLALMVQQLGDFMRDNKQPIEGLIGVLEGDWLDAIRQFRKDIGLADFVDGIAAATGQVSQSAAEIEASVLAVLTSASGVSDTAGLTVLVERMADGEIGAEDLQQALVEMGGTAINFVAVDKLAGLIGQLRTARLEAQALATGTATPRGPQGRGGKRGAIDAPDVTSVKLGDYPILGDGKKTKKNEYQSATESIRERTDALAAETAALSSLNPLVNDYGFAVERARAEHDLLTAAKAAGIPIDATVRENIAKLATGYANAAVEAEKLAESQDGVRESAVFMRDGLKDATSSFVSDLIEGKTAAEAFGNALNNIGDRLINLGLDGLFGGGQTKGFGAVGKLFGLAKGGIVANGRPKMFANGGVSDTAAVFGEAGPEAAVPLPDGRRIPVDLRMPKGGGGGPAVQMTFAPTIDARGADQSAVDRIERVLAKQGAEFDARVVATVKGAQQRRVL